MRLAEVGTTLSTLIAPRRLAPLATPMTNAEASPPPSTLRTVRHHTPLPATVGDTELRPTVHALRAPTLERATFTPAVTLAEGGAPFCPLLALGESAPLTPSVRLAEHRAPLGTLRA